MTMNQKTLLRNQRERFVFFESDGLAMVELDTMRFSFKLL